MKGPLTWQKVETPKFENINLAKREKKWCFSPTVSLSWHQATSCINRWKCLLVHIWLQDWDWCQCILNNKSVHLPALNGTAEKCQLQEWSTGGNDSTAVTCAQQLPVWRLLKCTCLACITSHRYLSNLSLQTFSNGDTPAYQAGSSELRCLFYFPIAKLIFSLPG